MATRDPFCVTVAPRRRGHELPSIRSVAATMSRTQPARIPELSSSELFEQLFEFAPDCILVVGPGGVITRANRQVEVTLGYRRQELVGRSIELLVPDSIRGLHEQLVQDYFDHPRERLMGAGLNLTARRRDGSAVPVEIALRPLESGTIPLVLALVRDISERKEAERALELARADLERRVTERTAELSAAVARLQEEVTERERAERRLREEHRKVTQAEKLSSIGLLAAGVAHEINNPLGGTMSCIKALREGRIPPDRQGEYLDTVQEGLARMHATVRSLLDYARQQPAARSQVSIADVCSLAMRLVEPAARKRRIEFTQQLETRWGCIWGDRDQLMQAVVNVLLNAVQATPTGGKIEVALREASPETLGIRISDSGPGIPDELIDRVCDPFFTTKPEGEGTGLGLAITLGIVEAHGGSLHIAARPGGGSEVTLELRRCPPGTPP